MKKVIFFLVSSWFLSCAEQLMEKPDNLIPQEKMVDILSDLAIANAAKVTNAQILRKNAIEPTTYIFTKYDIDSIQFVESDRYYASIPEEHEKIYMAVEAKLEVEKERVELAKKIQDSLKSIKSKSTRKEITAKDSLPRNGGRKR